MNCADLMIAQPDSPLQPEDCSHVIHAKYCVKSTALNGYWIYLIVVDYYYIHFVCIAIFLLIFFFFLLSSVQHLIIMASVFMWILLLQLFSWWLSNLVWSSSFGFKYNWFYFFLLHFCCYFENSIFIEQTHWVDCNCSMAYTNKEFLLLSLFACFFYSFFIIFRLIETNWNLFVCIQGGIGAKRFCSSKDLGK